MKKLILSLAIAAIAFSANAQKSKSKESDGRKVKFSVGADLGIPVGIFSSVFNFAYGGDLQVDYATSPTFALNFSAGYVSFSVKNSLGGGGIGGGWIPVLVGGRYFFSPKVYGSTQLGISIATGSGGGTNFTYVPGIGVKISDNFDILAKFHSLTFNGGALSYAGVRLAYTFGPSK